MSRRFDGLPPRRALRVALGVLALGLAPAAAPAQSLGPDPYQPYNSMYKPFVYPTAPPSGGIPNMGRLDAIGSAPSPSRSFSNYLESVGAGTPDPFARPRGNVSRFTPYYRSYRQFDDEFQRRTDPATPDDFYRDQNERHRRYIEALRERDPKKRQALLKAIETENRNATRASNDPNRFRDYRESRQAEEPKAAAANRGAANAAAPVSRPGGGMAAAAGRTPPLNPAAPVTESELDALPDPGPLPPDPNQSRRPTPPPTPLGLESLRRPSSAAIESGIAPSRVLERSRLSDLRRNRRSLQDLPPLPGEPGDASSADLDRPAMTDPLPPGRAPEP